MRKKFQRTQRLSALTEINVTPLIDLAFALLIIFMITAPLLEQTINIQLPIESQRPQTEKNQDTFEVISVDQHGNYYIGDQPVEELELRTYLMSLAEESESPVIDIRGDAKTPYQHVITLIDLLKQNQLSRISLNTRTL